jgi:hypothetical protein
MLAQYLNTIVAELNQLATHVQGIKVQQGAPNPVSSLSTIATSLANVNARMAQCNGAGQIGTADRHYMGAQFQAIATELNK